MEQALNIKRIVEFRNKAQGSYAENYDLEVIPGELGLKTGGLIQRIDADEGI